MAKASDKRVRYKNAALEALLKEFEGKKTYLDWQIEMLHAIDEDLSAIKEDATNGEEEE